MYHSSLYTGMPMLFIVYRHAYALHCIPACLCSRDTCHLSFDPLFPDAASSPSRSHLHLRPHQLPSSAASLSPRRAASATAPRQQPTYLPFQLMQVAWLIPALRQITGTQSELCLNKRLLACPNLEVFHRSRSLGSARSRSEITRCVAFGQTMARSGSSQRTPRA